MGIIPSSEVVVYPHIIYAEIASVDISGQTAYVISLRVKCCVRPLMNFLPKSLHNTMQELCKPSPFLKGICHANFSSLKGERDVKKKEC